MDAAEAAPLACAGVTTFNSLRNMDLVAGDIVAVQGVGGQSSSDHHSNPAARLIASLRSAGLGHLAIQFARQSGYKTVAISRGGGKKALAEELGAHIYIDSDEGDAAKQLQELGGAKVIIGKSCHRAHLCRTRR